MDPYLALMIVVGFSPIVGGTGLILVTPKDGSVIDPEDLDAMCCSLACQTGSEPESENVDGVTANENPICKCDSLCVDYDDCCPDFWDRRTNRSRLSHDDELQKKMDCVWTSSAKTSLYQEKYGFFMVSSCLEPRKDWGAFGDLCEALRPSFTKISLQALNATIQMLPVASNVTGLHYKNVYCALCNWVPVSNLVPWVARSILHADSEGYVRYWFEPPSAPSSVNITQPRRCITGVEVSDPYNELNTSIAKECSGLSNILYPGECLVCSQHLDTPRCRFPNMPMEALNFKIPFNFPSFVQQIELVPCPGSFVLDPIQRKCVHVLGPTDTKTPSTENLLCASRHSETHGVWVRPRISPQPESTETVRRDVRLAFRKAIGVAGANVKVVSSPQQHDWNPIIAIEESRAIVFKVQVQNSSVEHVLSAVANDLVLHEANRSYIVSLVEFMMPCGDYAIDQCMTDSDLIEVQDDHITMRNDALIFNISNDGIKSSKLLRKVGYGFKSTDVRNITESSQLFICNVKEHSKSEQAQQFLYVIGTVSSLLGLLLTFLTYMVLPGLRTVPGIGTMNLVAATFTAQLGLLVAGQTANIVTAALCTALAAILHYVWLASFMWTSCLALGLSRALGNHTGMQLRRRSERQTAKFNAFYGWGGPGLIVTACLIVHFAGRQNQEVLVYGGGSTCWVHPKEANLVVFGVPVMLSLLANVGMFAKAVLGVRASKKATKRLNAHISFIQRTRLELTIYVKVSLLMGFSWLWALLGAFTRIDAFWFFFVIFNSFQGAYIFMAFVCNLRVLRMLRVRLVGLRGKSNQSQAANHSARATQMTHTLPASNKKLAPAGL